MSVKLTLREQGFQLGSVCRGASGSTVSGELRRMILDFKSGSSKEPITLQTFAASDGFPIASDATDVSLFKTAPSHIGYARQLAEWIGYPIWEIWPGSYYPPATESDRLSPEAEIILEQIRFLWKAMPLFRASKRSLAEFNDHMTSLHANAEAFLRKAEGLK